MADNKLRVRENADDGFFAEDDPLAELARIVSFEPQAEARPKPVTTRREPEFDLEDELLKEFEQYEAPATEVVAAPEPSFESQSAFEPQSAFAPQSDFVRQPAFEPTSVYEPEPTFEPEIDAEPELDADFADLIHSELVHSDIAPASSGPDEEAYIAPVRAVPELKAVETDFTIPVEPVRPVSHPVFDLEDEILREFAAFDARREGHAPRVEPPAIGGLSTQPVPEIEPDAEPHFAPVAREHVVTDVVSHVEPDFDTFADVETFEAHDAASGYGDEQLGEPEEVEIPVASIDEYGAPDSEPVDAAQWRETTPISAEEARPEEEAGLEEESLISLADEDLFGHEEVVEEPVRLEIEPQFPSAQTPQFGGVADERPRDFGETAVHDDFWPETVDEELARIAEEPVVAEIDEMARQPAPAPVTFAEVPHPAPFTRNMFGLVTPAAPVERRTDAEPRSQWLAPEPETDPVRAAPAENPVPVSAALSASADDLLALEEPVTDLGEAPAPAALPTVDAFDDGAFELDLSEIELDILEMEVESAVAPGARQDEIVASPSAIADMAEAKVEEKPAVVASRSWTPQPPRVEDYSSLPFDPSQVSEDDEGVEALAEMSVPDMPVADHEVAVPAQPDYDIDIDAEMAHIFAPRNEAPGRAQAAQSAVHATKSAPQSVSADLDEFERALEEDFRRSLSENRATSTPDRVALTPMSVEDDDDEGRGRRRIAVIAASVAGLLLVGGAGVYAYMGGSSEILATSSEPKIILADKDPVKVAPKDPGGQTVPNQDKAVYDRVSGDSADVAKQERLVTSDEEPVDVVQKTLMPESLPMDGDEPANLTDTSDTSDPRLLPPGEDKNVTTTEKVVNGVAPRKVRTMVVRPDGTLMPRDEESQAEQAADAGKEASAERSIQATPEIASVPERLTANDATGKLIEEASADSKSFVPDAAAPAADTAQEKLADKQPADQQPVAVEGNDEVASDIDAAAADAKAAEAAAEKPQEIAAAPAVQPEEDSKSADQNALNDAANAEVEETAPVRVVKTTTITNNTPVPENRPAEQPVNVVGTVTDQGNVRDTAAAETQDVASATPEQATETTKAEVQVPAGSYVIQIASLPSEDDARNSYSRLSVKFASVIGGRGVDIKRAEIKNKGTYYRVRIPAGTKQEAAELCARYKAAGGSCLVSR